MENVLWNDEIYVYEYIQALTVTFNNDNSVIMDNYHCGGDYPGCNNWSLSEGNIGTETFSWMVNYNEHLFINFEDLLWSTTLNSPSELVMVLYMGTDGYRTLTMNKCSLEIDCLGQCGGTNTCDN